MTNLPKDPVILLSYLNTQLRDHYSSLEDFCASTGTDKMNIIKTLTAIDYEYDASLNQFI
ncbi:MAG: DUF4250 domain-containing protein [Clostridiales bacterium]|nr:DUF4250 domain-containing protein [Clostridiales bacterium]